MTFDWRGRNEWEERIGWGNCTAPMGCFDVGGRLYGYNMNDTIQTFESHLFALSALERPLPLVLVLPHVVHQVALCHKLFLADVTGVRLLAMVFHPGNSSY